MVTSAEELENSMPQEALESMQDSLIRRFSKSPKPTVPIVFEFTNDKSMLHQYFRLRDQVFGRDIAISDGSGGADIHDKISHILVARRDNLVIGGCRLTVREGDESFLLPMESEDFKLRSIFTDLPLNHERHGVISKLTILEDHNSRDIMYGLCRIMFDRIVMSNIPYMFFRSRNYVLARNWRIIAKSCGAENTRICEEINMPNDPAFPGEKPYLSYSNFSELCFREFSRIPVPTTRKLELV